METCVRGFSFMADNQVELADLQYIEGGELERTWRTTRRERIKQREQKIWDEFVKEKDVVSDVCTEDPYQFLEQLPESCLQEIMEKELAKMAEENSEDEIKAEVLIQQDNGNGDSTTENTGQHTCVVTFANDAEDGEDSEMFHIFDDEQSGEDEILTGSLSPSTVREKAGSKNESPERLNSLEKVSSKSSENVTNVIESSIYCAKVKDLRIKINEELISLMTSLDRRDILSAEPDKISRMIKRSAEFCARFNRIHMYQLQRQLHDIKRNNSVTLPFAKHTQFQSQMVRIVSLHQSILQSFLVFHKSIEQTCCIRESAATLGFLLAALRDCTHVCINVPPPKDFAAAKDLYKDDILSTCDKVDEFVADYAIRCEEFLNSFENVKVPKKPKEVKNKVKKRSFVQVTRNTAKNDNDARLAMYSLESLRLNMNPKSSSSKVPQLSNTSKMRIGTINAGSSNVKRGQVDKNAEPPKTQRKSRRPLMRDPHAGRPRAPRVTRDTDVRTLVEAVEACASTHISREQSPQTGRRSKMGTPRRALLPPLRAPLTPRLPPLTPRFTSNVQQPAAKNSPGSVPQVKHSTDDDSSSRQKMCCPSPKQTIPSKATLSTTKDDQEPIDTVQVTPVCKIQCAMKKDLESDDGSKHGECSKMEVSSKKSTPRDDATNKKDRERSKVSALGPDRCKVTRLLKQLCSGDTTGTERKTGAKNAQLVYVSGTSPRKPSTPQLLRILEETIQKKPKALFHKPLSARGLERYRLLFNIAEKTADTLFQYRTKFVQYMLTSALYANSAVGKPWEMIDSISEQIVEELLLGCLNEMELRDQIEELYKKETCCL